MCSETLVGVLAHGHSQIQEALEEDNTNALKKAEWEEDVLNRRKKSETLITRKFKKTHIQGVEEAITV